ncbi:alpha/beta hydrolase fold domain-containing protein [Nonomuraea sp. GTA35]|uniref:alpha/beta hydrolase fold domain-containing protein n=1 Tax=Nonomuraea sp. GTA35 TaxID=1676746 RepID=UPI0035C1EACD
MCLLLHGGTYTSGSAFGFRSLAGALADAVRGRVLTPDYRLAPEHRFPAALDDVHAAYTWLLDQRAAPCHVVPRRATSCWPATPPAPGSRSPCSCG